MSATYPDTLQRCGRFALRDRVITAAGTPGYVEKCSYRFIFVRLDLGFQLVCDPADLRHEEAEFLEAAE